MNKKFARRLRLYLIGVVMGILMVVVIFGERTELLTAWLPENAVIRAINTSEWQLDQQDSCAFTVLGDSLQSWKSGLEEADVLFSESNPKGEQRSYTLALKEKHIQSFQITFINDSLVDFGTWSLDTAHPQDCF